MEILLNSANAFPVVQLKGKFNSEIDSKSLLEIVEGEVLPNAESFIVDVKELEYLSSVGIGALITAFTKTRREGGEMVLCGVNDHVRKLLLMTKINSIFHTEDDVDSATRYLKSVK